MSADRLVLMPFYPGFLVAVLFFYFCTAVGLHGRSSRWLFVPWQQRTERLSCCHGRRLRLPAPQLCDSLRMTGLRSWKIVRYHWDQHIIRVCRVSVFAFAMSWGFGWPFRLLCLAATGASREELHRDSELLLSHRSVSDASRALAGGGVGLLNSRCPCIVACRICGIVHTLRLHLDMRTCGSIGTLFRESRAFPAFLSGCSPREVRGGPSQTGWY